ncbi:MAG: hypothetical protein Q7T55_25395 [Solirubrobacteraceae bacterium]|nr:hypothetical protein [Solirubrobacteraceae bacterium]
MPHSSPAPVRRALTLITALVLSIVAMTAAAAPASAATATVKKVFGGPLANGGSTAPGVGNTPAACNPDATATKTDASEFTDFCVAFRTYTDDADRRANAPGDVDLKSQVIDTPRGFAGVADAYPQCTNAQFAETTEADVTCPAGTQMGEVSADIRARLQSGVLKFGLGLIGLTEDNDNAKLTAPGRVFNLEHTENEVARLGIILDPSGAGIPQPKVKLVVRVTLRPSPDVGLRSLIDNMPTTAHISALGVDETDALSIDEFRLLFYGQQRGSMARSFGFLGSDCSNTQATSIRAASYDGTPSNADSVTYKLTDCDDANIPFSPSVAFSTTENRPDVTTETAVSVKFGNSTNAAYQPAGPKKTVVTLPDGLSFSGQIASGAIGLPLCTPAQFGQNRAEASDCSGATAVGTVSFRSPVQTRLLTGKVFLGSQPAPGELPDIYIEAQEGPAADAPRVKLVGNLTIDARNRIVTTLDNLPEVPVNEFLLTFRGGDQAAVVTPPQCGTGTGGLDASPFNKPNTPTSSTSDYTVSADCDAVKTFAPAVAFALDSPAAGKSSPFTTTVSRPDRSPRLATTQIELPAGTLATLKGVPECTTADATADTCPASTKVGTVSSLAGVGPAPYSAPGEVFLTQRVEGAVAGIVFRVPIVFGEVNLGVLSVPAKILIRPSDLGLTVLADVPQRFKGIPLNIRQLSIRLDRQGFPLSPTNCAPQNTVSKITSDGGTIVDAPAGLQVNDCAKLGFTPEIDAAVSGSTGNNGHPLVQVRVQNPAGNSALRQTFVTLPAGLGFDLKQQARACSVEDFKATKCPDVAKIGKVTGALSITEEPLGGDLYLLKAIKGDPLPGLGLAFKGRFSGNVAGTNAIAKTGQLITQFETLPDLPLTSFQLDVNGGDGSVLISTEKLCSASSVDIAATFVAHAGQKVDRKSSTYCGSKLGALTPRIKATLSGVRKGKPALVVTATAPLVSTTVNAMKFKQVDISLPSGYSLSTSRAKSSKGVAVKQLSVKGKSTSKRISTRKLRVKLPAAGSTKAKILSRTGTISIKSTGKRKSKAKVAITLTFTYTNGQKTSVPIRLTPR